METKIKDLLHKYYINNITQDEMKELAKEVNSHTDEELFSEFSNHWKNYEGSTSLSQQKKEELFNRIQKQIRTPFLVRIKTYWMQIAASLLIFISSSFAVSLYFENKEMEELSEKNVVIKSGEGSSTIELPDGSTVRLNAKSILSYRRDFGRFNRKVELSGEGYFEVRRDEKKQFIVATDFMEVAVLGTTFNVYAYKDKDIIEMSLIKGHVKVSTTKTTLNVHTNEKVIYDKRIGELTLQQFNTKQEVAWLSKELVFKHEKLSHIFGVLERKFGVTFIIDNQDLMNDIYTGTFNDNQITSVLDVLKMHYNFTYEIKNDNVYISIIK